MRKVLWGLWWMGALALGLVFACLGVAGLAMGGGRPKPLTLNYRRIPENPPVPSRIAVFGDTQKGLAGFAALAEKAKAEGVHLAIHTGDLVSRADAGHYDVATMWVERARLNVPFLVVPGNHDIKGGDGLFEERIGPRQFSCSWGPVRIVIVDNSTCLPDLDALEKTLSAEVRPILLFMHVPPFDAAMSGCPPKPEYAQFHELIRRHPVTYVFSGHTHGYSKFEDRGVVFISNGVGGDSESWQFGQKAYLTIVDVTETGLKAREISIDPVFSLRAEFEHLAIGHVGEIVFRRAWGAPVLLLWLVLWVLLARRRRKLTPPVAGRKFSTAKDIGTPDVVI